MTDDDAATKAQSEEEEVEEAKKVMEELEEGDPPDKLEDWPGGKAKYHKHLSDWSRLSAGDAKRLDGVTGASVGAGRTLKVTAELADALIDAGYEIRLDAAAEDMRDSPSEVRLPLSTANAGKPQPGKQYIQSVTFEFK